MQPPNLYHTPKTDLDAALSCAGMGTAWRPDAPPSPVWPTPYNPRQTQTALSPTSSPSSLTDRDLSRRALAASGLDVSAPEFVPSFAASPPAPSTPYYPPHQTSHYQHPPQPPTHHLHPQYFPEQLPYDFHEPYAHSPDTHSPYQHPADPVYNHRAPDGPTYDPHPTDPSTYDPHPADTASYELHAADATAYNPHRTERPAYDPAPTPTRPSHTQHQNFYQPSTPPRAEHLDEATYVNAVQHFDQQFPVLAKSPQNDSAKQTPTSPHLLHSALAWDALQREQKLQQQLRRKVEPYPAELDPDDDDIYDHDDGEPRVSNDIGAVWVTTGQSVGQLYQSLRAEAAEEARLRNKYFDRAAAAFKKNDGASAKRLGALGREANMRMKELHHRAAEAIFEARNPSHVTDVVDLHGLHVSEALERLPPAMERALPGTLRILTGTGHHTKGTGRARLRPAVKKWLQDEGYIFEEVVDANEYVGSFKVEIVR